MHAQGPSKWLAVHCLQQSGVQTRTPNTSPYLYCCFILKVDSFVLRKFFVLISFG
jgi:hypothetical protein